MYRNPLPGTLVSSWAFSDLFHPPVTAVRTHRDLFCTAGYNPMLLDFLALIVQLGPPEALPLAPVSL